VQAAAARDAIAGHSEKLQELATSAEEATAMLIFQTAAASADAATQLEMARALGLVNEEQYQIALATQAIIDQGTPNIVDPEEVQMLADLKAGIIDAKTVTEELAAKQGAVGDAVSTTIEAGTPKYVDPADVEGIDHILSVVNDLKGEVIPITINAAFTAEILDVDAVTAAIVSQVADQIVYDVNAAIDERLG
jgi:hypothetical protein